MVVNHVVIMSLHRAASDVEQSIIRDAFRVMARRIGTVKSFECGFDLGYSGIKAQTFSLIAKFDSMDEYLTYAKHPLHLEFVETHIKPILAEGGRHAVQYEVQDCIISSSDVI